MLNVSEHSQENTFTEVSFLINITAAANWSLSLFKKRFQHIFTSPRFLYFSKGHSDNGLRKKKTLKVVNNSSTIELWRSLTCQNSDADISPVILMADLISMHCYQKMLHFLSVSDGPTSTLSSILITLRKSYELVSVGYFWKMTNTCERCFISEASQKRRIFWDMLQTS